MSKSGRFSHDKWAPEFHDPRASMWLDQQRQMFMLIAGEESNIAHAAHRELLPLWIRIKNGADPELLVAALVEFKDRFGIPVDWAEAFIRGSLHYWSLNPNSRSASGWPEEVETFGAFPAERTLEFTLLRGYSPVREGQYRFRKRAMAAFEEALDEYINGIEKDAESRGLVRTPAPRGEEGRQDRLLARVAVGPKNLAQIARDAKLTPKALSNVVNRRAVELGLPNTWSKST